MLKDYIICLTAILLFIFGIAADVRARNSSDSKTVEASYDLIVVGMGSGGFGAALAAARQGLSVLCLEKADRIGGTAVRAGVSMWEPGVGGTGIPFEVYGRLKTIPDAVGIYSFGRHISWDGWEAFPGGEHVIDSERRYDDTLRRHPGPGKSADATFRKDQWHGVVFEPGIYEQVLRGLLSETGCATIRTETTFKKVEQESDRVIALHLTTGERVAARFYVDATGGGELCKACGCETMYGQESQGRFNEPSAPAAPNTQINGVTLIFRISRIKEPGIEPLAEGIPDRCWWGKFPAMSAVQYPNGDYNCNMLPTMEGKEFAKLGHKSAYNECCRRVCSFWHHVQEQWPEFQRYRISWIAPALGVRETTRVVGEYILTENDLRAGLSGRNHPDVIAIADHALDWHGTATGAKELPKPYGIPYRCLLPKGMKNVLVACRGASFSSIAASSFRLSRTMVQHGVHAKNSILVEM